MNKEMEKKVLRKLKEIAKKEGHMSSIIKYYNKYYFLCPFTFEIYNKEVIVKCDSLKEAEEEQHELAMDV